MYHEICRQRVGGRVTNIVGGDRSADIAALLQDIVYLEADGAVLLTEELFLDGGVPQPFILRKTIGVTGIGAVVDVALDGDIPGEIEGGIGISTIIEIFLVALPLQAVLHLIVVDIATDSKSIRSDR